MQRSLLNLQTGEAFGRYELLLPVAQGGMSMVWAARLRGTRGFQKLVAIKTLLATKGAHAMLEQMLLDEARLASQIQHPNVAQYLDLGERDDVLYVVMEWIDGESLRSVIRHAARSGGMPLAIAAQIVEQACKGLHGAHELRDALGKPLGLVHCDVSPRNLMLADNGAVRLIDFGIAKATSAHADHRALGGKSAFMAPEQALGRPIDRRADLFALGIVLYLLTTGRHPFSSKTSNETLQRIVQNELVTPPSSFLPNYPSALERVVMRALEHHPADRFESAAEMLRALTEAVPERACEPELGAFVARVAGEALSERRAAISKALADADARAPESGPPSGAFEWTSSQPKIPVGSEAARVEQSVSSEAPVASETLRPAEPPQKSRRHRGLLFALTATVAAVASFTAFRTGAFDRWFDVASASAAHHSPFGDALPSSASISERSPGSDSRPTPAASSDDALSGDARPNAASNVGAPGLAPEARAQVVTPSTTALMRKPAVGRPSGVRSKAPAEQRPRVKRSSKSTTERYGI